jgi:hypothetical protein
MTETSLRHYLKMSGWTAIIATFVNFVLSTVQRTQRMSELGVDDELRAQTYALYTIIYGVELPIILSAACLCLMASRTLTYKQQTLETIFE